FFSFIPTENRSPFEVAMMSCNRNSVALLLETTQGKAAECCKPNFMKERNYSSFIDLFLQYNLTDFAVGQFFKNIEGIRLDVVYNEPSSVLEPFRKYIEEHAEFNVIECVDEQNNTLLHAAVLLQDV